MRCSLRWALIALGVVGVGACAGEAPPPLLPTLSAGPHGGPIPVSYMGPKKGPKRAAVTANSAASIAPEASSAAPAEESAPPAPSAVPASSLGPPLPSGLYNPLPGGTLAGYVGDTGLDIASTPHDVYAVGAGTIEYAEAGHTRWVGPKDTPYCVRLRLDHPVTWKKRLITHAYYAHMSSLAFEQHEGHVPARHVTAGELLGKSGIANGLPHLHLGLLLDGDVSQDTWDTILVEGDVRTVLGVGKNGTKLPG